MAVAVGVAFFLGCARPSAQTEQQKAIVSPVNSPAVVGAQVAPGLPDPNALKADADTNAPAILERIPPSTRPDNLATTSGIGEVAKLAQAGVSEQVMLAFVEKYHGRFEVGADQIIYLNDLGVSSTVITAMLKHDDGKAPAVVAQAPPTQASEPQPQTPPAQPTTPGAVPPPTSSTEVSYFYDSLSPYGSWIYLSGYGWCWQPTVAVSAPAWRPYCDNGSWYWSDGGWYWNSDYSWGWAAFHYGRWYHHSRSGWVWTPGTVWGPSWVSWRYQSGYCGWAPLPPEAHFVHGSGFTYRGSHVSIGFEFGLSSFHYSFVHANRFCDPHPYRHVVARPTVVNIYNNTTVVNNYRSGNNRTVINDGIGKETIARSGGSTRVREVTVRETPMSGFSSGRGQKPERQGNQLVAYRPQLPPSPPTVRTAPGTGRANPGGTTAGRSNSAGGNTSPTPNTPQRSQPVAGSRGNSEVARGVPGTGPAPANPNAGRQPVAARNDERNTTPVTAPAPARGQPSKPAQRGDNSLFGNSGAERSQPRNNPPVAQAPVRSAPQQLPPAANVTPRPQPQTPATQPRQVAPRTEQPHNGAQSRVAPNNPYQSPRQYEQAPRRVEPAPSANPAPQVSRPTTGGSRSQERSVPSSGGSPGNSGSGRGERSERSR